MCTIYYNCELWTFTKKFENNLMYFIENNEGVDSTCVKILRFV